MIKKDNEKQRKLMEKWLQDWKNKKRENESKREKEKISEAEKMREVEKCAVSMDLDGENGTRSTTTTPREMQKGGGEVEK